MVQENKLNLTKRILEAVKKQMEALAKVLKDKEDDISKSKEQLRRAKEDAVNEYCNSDALLYELGGSFAEALMTASVKSRPPFQIWTCPSSPSTPKARPQLNMLIKEILMSCL